LGSVSPYLLDLAVAASIITFPAATGKDLTFRPIGFAQSQILRLTLVASVPSAASSPS